MFDLDIDTWLLGLAEWRKAEKEISIKSQSEAQSSRHGVSILYFIDISNLDKEPISMHIPSLT